MDVVINIYLTWKCNFQCAHCCHDCGPDGDHMSEDKIDYIFNFIEWIYSRNLGLSAVGISGGEPTLHPLFWPKVVPFLSSIRMKYRLNHVELHTNASIPVPKEQYTHFTRLFSRIFVGHDIFHDKFKKLNELDVIGYTELTNSLQFGNIGMCYDPKENSYIQCIRTKGRAAHIDPNMYVKVTTPVTPAYQCPMHTGANCLYVSFTPDHINFCGEKSHPVKENPLDEGQFFPYTIPFEDVIAGSIKYDALYGNKFCSQHCIAEYVKELSP